MNELSQFPQVDRRSNLSLREFRRNYLARGLPVVITDAAENWKARSTWTFDYFKSRYGNTPTHIPHIRATNLRRDTLLYLPKLEISISIDY